MHSFDDHHIWNEHEWEAHIDEMTRRHEHLRHILELENETPRWLHHLRHAPTKIDAVDAFIEEELQIEESNFPLDDDEYDGDDFFIDQDDAPEGELPFYDDEFEDDDDVEKLFEDIFEDESDDESQYGYAPLDNITVYTEARDFSAELLLFQDTKPRYLKDKGFMKLISATLQLSSKLAAAYSMGFDMEVLGATIAYSKKALAIANDGLADLQKLKNRPLDVDDYYELHRKLFALRNNIAIHIQDTREFFNECL